ncbi:Uncharacterized protein DBV15_07382 [Temnothorax longispinosus]|uniref:Uncharacterized protein n=1 Tax=Temnothorax longispinosus TaxID=300112 RepID=A0A4S2L470_9HYME|nr:Uncharacterized protein DBV15_07382 [Temnothorax longispinosus]
MDRQAKARWCTCSVPTSVSYPYMTEVVLLEVVGKEGWFAAKGGFADRVSGSPLQTVHWGETRAMGGLVEERVWEHERERRERSSTVSDYCWHCEVQTWGRRRESGDWGGGRYARAGPVDKTVEIGKTAGTSLKQKRDGEAEEEEEEVIRNTVREYNTTSTPE